MRLPVLLLMFLCAVPCVAEDHEWTVEIKGSVWLNNRPVADARIEAQTDPFWGHLMPEPLEKFRATGNDIPDATATGSATADKNGDFEILVTIKTTGVAPEIANYHPNPGKVAHLWLTITSDKSQRSCRYFRGIEHHPQGAGRIEVKAPYKLTGRVIDEKGKSQTDYPLILKGRMDAPYGQGEEVETRGKTDAYGRFEFIGTDIPGDSGVLSPDVDGMTWSDDVFGHGRVNFPHQGHHEMKDLTVVRGGQFVVRVVDDLTGGLIPAQMRITMKPGRYSLYNQPNGGGEYESELVPPGSYLIDVDPESAHHGEREVAFEVKPGEITTIPDIRCLSRLDFDVIAREAGGGGLDQFHLQIQHIEGEIPGSIAKDLRGRTYSRRYPLTAEKITVNGLFAGKFVALAIQGSMSSQPVYFELPLEGPLQVELLECAELTVTTLDINQREIDCDLYLVMHGTPLWEEVKDGWPARSEWRYDGLQLLAYTGRTGARGKPIQNVAPGTYELFSLAHSSVMHRTTVELREGQSESVTLKPTLGKLSALVTENGLPASGKTVHLVTRADSKWVSEPTRTNKEGIATFDQLRPGEYSVVTDLEREWLGDLNTSRDWRSMRLDAEAKLQRLRKTYISYSTDITVPLELNDKLRTFLNVEVKLPDGVSITSAGLEMDPSSRIGIWRSVPAEALSESELAFGPVGPGTWVLNLTLLTKPDQYTEQRMPFYALVNVPEAGHEKIVLKPKFHTVSGKVKAAKGDGWRVPHVTLVPLVGDLALETYGRMAVMGSFVDEKGSFKIENVPEGSYAVITETWNETTRFNLTDAERIEVKKDVKNVKLELDEDFGHIKLNVVGKANGWSSDFTYGHLRVLNDKGEEVVLNDPRQNWMHADRGRGFMINSLKPGKYTIEAWGVGFEPMRDRNIVVEAGTTVDHTLNGLPSAGALIEFAAPLPATIPYSIPAEVVFENTDGKVLQSEMPLKWLAGLNWMGNHYRLDTRTMPKGTRRVRLRLPGYKEAVVDVVAMPGETRQYKSELIPE